MDYKEIVCEFADWIVFLCGLYYGHVSTLKGFGRKLMWSNQSIIQAGA
jgi:hypothetical protein